MIGAAERRDRDVETRAPAHRIVEPGRIDTEHVVTPGIFVDRVVEVADARQEEAMLREGAEQ